jgi:lipoyl(octanoyl) transferase
MPKTTDTIICKHLGILPYANTLTAMQEFTLNRTYNTKDEIWFLQHEAVFTQGQAGKKEHILNPGNIPIIQSDRGGQVTYHAPGQLIVYLLIDLKKRNINIREFVTILESSVITLLQYFDIHANADIQAPGVYISGKKVCSIGVRIKKGCSYHGLSLNIDLDLEPFSRINPCGYKDLKVTQIKNFNKNISLTTVANLLETCLIEKILHVS